MADVAARIRRSALDGDLIPDGTRNITLASIAGRFRWEGFERPEITTALLAVNQSRCVPPLNGAEVRTVAASISKKPNGAAGASVVPRAEYDAARGDLVLLTELVLRWRWTGRNATTKRGVLLAILRIAYRAGRVRVSASERQLAEFAGVGRKAVHRALVALVADGWLGKIPQRFDFADPTQPARATIWHVKRPKRIQPSNVLGRDVSAEIVTVLTQDEAPDVWRNMTGLGHSAERVYAALSVPAPSARRFALALGMNQRTVLRAIHRLEQHGLANRTEAGWQRTDASPDAVGTTLRSHGTLERQRREHEHDREKFERTRVYFAHLRVSQNNPNKTKYKRPVACIDAVKAGNGLEERDGRGPPRASPARREAGERGATGEFFNFRSCSPPVTDFDCCSCSPPVSVDLKGVFNGDPVEKSRAAPADRSGWHEIAGESPDARTNRRRQFLRAQMEAIRCAGAVKETGGNIGEQVANKWRKWYKPLGIQ